MPRNKTVAIAFAVLAVLATAQTVTPQPQKIAIVGATLIDVSNYGQFRQRHRRLRSAHR